MINLLEKFYNSSDERWILNHVKNLTEIEMGQTFDNYKQSAEYAYNLLKNEGFDAEILTFPADGKTVYQDKRMPLAWRASVGRLTNLATGEVIADYEKMPFSLVKHSVSTPECGIKTLLITEAQAFSGVDVKGNMVLLDSEAMPTAETISPLLDMGALGFVTDFLSCGTDTPDCIGWVNAATDDGDHWHVQCEDRDFIGFSISPRVGKKLRSAASRGNVEVLVESDGERYEGEINAVTALLPGKNKKEIWILSHLFEPLATDNSTGVICAIETLKQLKNIKLEYSVRVVFAMELYGFAAVADYFGGSLHDKVIGGINTDGMQTAIGEGLIKKYLVPAATPFFGNYIYSKVLDTYGEKFGKELISDTHYRYSDDMALGDSTVGLPTVWPVHDNPPERTFWHNSCRNTDTISGENCRRAVALVSLFVHQMATLTEDKIPTWLEYAVECARERINAESKRNNAENRMRFFFEAEKRHISSFAKIADIPEIEKAVEKLVLPQCGQDIPLDTPWLKYAEGIVAKRETIGLPNDLVKLPKNNRKPSWRLLYTPMTTILSAMDGKRNLKDIICGALWENGEQITDSKVKKYVGGVLLLADAGYVSVQNENDIDKEQIKKVLGKIGVREGDTLLVHSGLSGCGHIIGGENTVIDAFVETVGEKGGVMFPSFNYSFAGFEGTQNKAKKFRPFSPHNIDSIWTGSIPKAVLRREGALRSAHSTHSWCGFGEKAKICLAEQGLLDPPANEKSPMAKALQQGGKVVFFGCTPASNTFIHFLEDGANGSYLGNAIVRIEEENGAVRTELIHKHLPGCRDFYNPDISKVKFYNRAIEKGLEIRKEKLGAGYVYYMELKPLYEIGTQLFKEDKNVTLCDKPDCMFCKKYR